MKKNINFWLRKTKGFSEPNDALAYRQLFPTVGMILFLLFVSHFLVFHYSFFFLPVTILPGVFLARIFALQHDCGHGSFLSSQKKNNLVGFCLSLLTHIPYKSWSVSHKFHHNHNEKIELTDIGDVKTITVNEYRSRSFFNRLRYKIFRFSMVIGLAGIVYIFWYQRVPMASVKSLEPLSKKNISREWKKIKASQSSFFITNMYLTVLYFLGFYFLGWSFIITQLLIICIFSIFAMWFFYVQHQYEMAYKAEIKNWNYLDAALKGSSYYKLPKFLNYLTCDIGLHFLHHLNDKIPNYRLYDCYMAHKKDFDEVIHILSFRKSLRSIFLHLYDTKNKRMISFREFYKMS